MPLIRSSASLGLIKWKDYVIKAVDLFKRHQKTLTKIKKPIQQSKGISDNNKIESASIKPSTPQRPNSSNNDIEIEWLD